MAKKTKVTDKDKGYKKRMTNMVKADDSGVDVGILKEKAADTHDGSGTVIQIAAAHEFGVGVPRRSWLRDTFDKERSELNRYMKVIGEKIAAGGNTKRLLDRLGAKFTADIQKLGMTSKAGPSGDWEPLAEETKARKGSDTMLLDTGVLRASVTWKTKV